MLPSADVRLGLAIGIVAALATTAPRPAHAYEFWLRAETIGQAYQLRDYRLAGPDLFLGNRSFAETLALRIFDIGDLSAARRRARVPDRGLRVSWQSYLRVDHDFGTYATGKIAVPGIAAPRDALDVIPELSDQLASLQLLYGFVELDGMFDDALSVKVGRILADESWGTTAVDGASARVELPQPIAISASAGLHVRAASPLGIAAYELDGTSGAGCTEYVEGATPDTGHWQLIDRNRTITNTRLASDYEYCPQRDVEQPTVGVTIATSRLQHVHAELGYRRTWSDTVGLIGPVDRFPNPDTGLYPTTAPATGVNEERLWARASGDWHAGGFDLAPYAGVRYSLLHGLVDRGELGLRIAHGAHALEPAVEYFYPTFDGDSIFNVFSITPTVDARLGYRSAPAGPWRALADVWVRRYLGTLDGDAYAGGVDGAVERATGARTRVKLDALADTGYGGRRIRRRRRADLSPRHQPLLARPADGARSPGGRDDRRRAGARLRDGERDREHDVARRRVGRHPRHRRARSRRRDADPDARDRRARSRVQAGAVRRAIVALVLAAFAAVCALGVAYGDDDHDNTEWSPIVYPAQRLPLVFSHAKHAARGTACIACHANAPTSQSAVDDLLPTEAACRACHPIDRADPDKAVAEHQPPARCDACHAGYVAGAGADRRAHVRDAAAAEVRARAPRADRVHGLPRRGGREGRSRDHATSSCRRWRAA